MATADTMAQAASAAAAASQRRVAGLRTAVVLGLCMLPFALFWPGSAALVSFWNDTDAKTYTHGWLVAGLAVWLLLRNHARFAAPIASHLAVAPALLVLGAAWLVAYKAGIQIVFISLLPVMSLLAVLACFGWRSARAALPAVAYLFFAIPVWGAINPLLQWSSVLAVRFVLRVIGIPVHFDGALVHIPAGTFEIADACSGLHYFIVALAIGALYGELHRDRIRTRVLLVALSAAFAVLANWIRIVIIVIAGHTTDMQHPLVSDEHYTFGWYVFAAAMVLFFLVARRLPVESAGAQRQAADFDLGANVIPVRALFATVAVLSLAPAWNLASRALIPEHAGESALPRVNGWSGPHEQEAAGDWAPLFVGADLERRAAYRHEGRQVELYSAVYFEQRQGKELIGYGNSLLGPGWTIHDRRTGPRPPWTELEATDARGDRWLIAYAYRIGDAWYAGGRWFQLRYGIEALLGMPESAVLIARIACESECAAMRLVLNDFFSAAWPPD